MIRHNIIQGDLEQIVSADLPWAELAGKSVLITGANGFVPAYLVETLLCLNEGSINKPVKVLALVRNKEKALARFAGYKGRPDLQFVVQDVCNTLEVQGPIDYIIHAASQASPKFYSVDPAGTIKPNVIGTFNLLELARQKGTRGFLFVSSGEVYGKFRSSSEVAKEDVFGTLDPLELRSCYAEGKRAGETLCKAWCHQYGIPIRIARLGHTYGPGMDLNDGRVFADFVANIVRGENIEMKSDGTCSRPFCYLSDAVIGLLLVLLKGRNGEAYNLVNNQAVYKIVDLANTLCNLFPEKKLKVIRHINPLKNHVWNSGFRIDTTKAREQLGWHPSISVENGFRKTVNFYQSAPHPSTDLSL